MAADLLVLSAVMKHPAYAGQLVQVGVDRAGRVCDIRLPDGPLPPFTLLSLRILAASLTLLLAFSSARDLARFCDDDGALGEIAKIAARIEAEEALAIRAAYACRDARHG